MVLRQSQTTPVRQLLGQTEAFGGLGGDDDERIGVLAVAVEARRAELRLTQRPFDQGREGRSRAVEHQPVDAVCRAVPAQHGERAVDEPGVGGGGGVVGVGVWAAAGFFAGAFFAAVGRRDADEGRGHSGRAAGTGVWAGTGLGAGPGSEGGATAGGGGAAAGP